MDYWLKMSQFVSFPILESIEVNPQLTFTWSKSIIETLDKGVKYVQS